MRNETRRRPCQRDILMNAPQFHVEHFTLGCRLGDPDPAGAEKCSMNVQSVETVERRKSGSHALDDVTLDFLVIDLTVGAQRHLAVFVEGDAEPLAATLGAVLVDIENF